MTHPKRKALDVSVLEAAAVAQPDPLQQAAAMQASNKGPPSRANKVQVQGWFPEETRRRLKMLAAREGRSVEDLLGEAIEDLFEKRKADGISRK